MTDDIANRLIGARNERGIPSALFVEDVQKFVGNDPVEGIIGALQQLYSKYKFMETNLSKSKQSFKTKIPDTEKDLAMLEHLIAQREKDEVIETHFSLADNVFANATIDSDVQTVCIWLGANVMVEYSFDEALELLQGNLKTATTRLTQIESDLAFLRDQIITTEVNMARIFNFDVRRRRQEKDSTPAVKAS
ncbi:prefoldin subunit 3 [Thraustotheca clavata]|uniref:Prefoldin subunit 3 n=1 Tax=Thraustotheca clavata TaxID=74557 RepID=A0A1V9ZYI7_9STRA|nr:prefoldin subunit 3 [Thraustotheca clavata]